MNDLVMNICGIAILVVFLFGVTGCSVTTDLIACTINICN